MTKRETLIPSYCLDRINFDIDKVTYTIFMIAFKGIAHRGLVFYNDGMGYVLKKNNVILKKEEISDILINTMKKYNFIPRD